ncbi:MAG: hypothetical protein ACI8WM_002744 [Burkholderiaceae bacterium]
MLLLSVKTTLLTLLTLARTPILRVLLIETVPLDLNVAMDSPVSALTTVKLVTVCAATHIGTNIKVAKEIVRQGNDIFILYLLF